MRAALTSATSRATRLVLVLAAEVCLGYALHRDLGIATVVAVAGLGLVIVAASPYAVVALAFPATVATWRLAVGDIDISYADVAITALLPIALWRTPLSSRAVRRLGLVTVAYATTISIGVVARPSIAATVEVAHRLVMVLGAVSIGAAVAVARQDRRALRSFLTATTALAIVAVYESVRSSFEPAYPLGLQKNAAGILIGSGVIVLAMVPTGALLTRGRSLAVAVIGVVGVLACQSRAAALTLGAVVVVAAVKRRGQRGWLLLMVPVVVAASFSVADRDIGDTSAGARFNSVNSRLDGYRQAWDVFSDSPIVGGGLRYWRTPEHAGTYEPHNVVMSTLGESGLLGLLGMVLLLLVTINLARRARSPYAPLAVALTAAHVLDSLMGIFWVAGPGTLPWLALGLALGSGRESLPDPAPEPLPEGVTQTADLVPAGV